MGKHIILPKASELAKMGAMLDGLTVVENELTAFQKARLGKITASNFEKVKRLKNGEWSEAATTYLYDLVGEHLTGKPAEFFTGSRATDWGNRYEQEAIEAYKKRTGRKVKAGRFVQDAKMLFVGGTPDGFVGEKGLIEVKCPFTFKNHLRTVIERKVPQEYMPQVLGNLMLSGREWCDFVSYDPRIDGINGLVIVRVKAEDYKEENSALAASIIEFHAMLLNMLKKLGVAPNFFIGRENGIEDIDHPPIKMQ